MMAVYRDDILEVLDDRFVEYPLVMRGLIFGHPAYKIDNKVFAFVAGDGLSVKLSKTDYEKCLELDFTETFAPGGTPMGTWVIITYADAPEYLDNWHWIEKAMAFIQTAEGAPPKKKRKKK
jgi:hypothetical protein